MRTNARLLYRYRLRLCGTVCQRTGKRIRLYGWSTRQWLILFAVRCVFGVSFSVAALKSASEGEAMKLGMVTDSLSYLSFDALVETASKLGLQMLEFACGNWSPAPHVNLDLLLDSKSEREKFLGKIRDH